MQSCSGTDGAKTETNKAANSAVAKTSANMPPAASDSHADSHADEASRITLEEAKKDFDAGNAVFVDTRAESAFRVEHIKGAINIPAEAFATRYSEVPKDKKIIAYCS